MAQSIYITSAEGHAGKSSVALGVLNALKTSVSRVAIFRPIARETSDEDYVLEFLNQHATANISFEDSIGTSYEHVHTQPEEALVTIVERYKAVQEKSDAVVILGSDYTDVASPTELSFNARVAANLNAPVLLVLGGRVVDGTSEVLGQSSPRKPKDLAKMAELAALELEVSHAKLLAVVINRADENKLDKCVVAVEKALENHSSPAVWAIPENKYLVAPTVSTVMQAIEGKLLHGSYKQLNKEALSVVIAGMSIVNVLPRLIDGSVIIVPGDRYDVLLAVLMAHASKNFPSMSAIILNGGFKIPKEITTLLDGVNSDLPIISTGLGTFDATMRITHTRGRLAADSDYKFNTALSLFEQYVNSYELLKILKLHAANVTTPTMFAYSIFDRARKFKKHIVLPEGNDKRVLKAAAMLLQRSIVDITLLGDENKILQLADSLGINLKEASIINPASSVLREEFAHEYAKIRVHKGMSYEQAYDVMVDVSYFGTMMVQLGYAHGMVSGAAHTTAHTIRPSFEIIKTKQNVSIVSSVFLMLMADRVLVYGDCAVNPDPSAEQLADIAISSAETAVQFGIEPKIAMLSYSTGESGTGADVEKVRQATQLVRKRRPDLLIEGPIQYDAATDKDVAETKMPNSKVAGSATVFIFPDLNTGNNTYKAVQRSAGAVAVGPVLQGLNKPVNDLSRGALVKDILNTVVITAIQAASDNKE